MHFLPGRTALRGASLYTLRSLRLIISRLAAAFRSAASGMACASWIVLGPPGGEVPTAYAYSVNRKEPPQWATSGTSPFAVNAYEKRRISLMVLSFGCFGTDLVTGHAGAGPCPPREPHLPVKPRPPRDVLPPRADPPREEPPWPPRPRPCAEPPHGTVPDGAEPEGAEPSGVAGPGDEKPVGAAPDGGEPGGDAPSPGAGGLTPPGEAGVSTPGASPEGPGAPSAGGDDLAGPSPRSRSVVSRIFEEINQGRVSNGMVRRV